jgi:beta-N-acetylhexosaminidase
MESSSLSLSQQVGQLFCVGIPGPELDAPTQELLDDLRPGAVCLFARNIRGARQTRELLDGLREVLGTDVLLSVDQEGGTVDRLRRIMSPMPAAATVKTAEDAAELGAIAAEALRILGFNMDFAPVVDVVNEQRSGFSRGLASRTFGASKEQVCEFAGAFLSALQSGGIFGCLKHFPGLGAATMDSHEDLPRVEISREELAATDLYPYRQLLPGVRCVMVAHAAFIGTGLQETAQNGKLIPSSLSYAFITKLLRDELAFDGLVITDDLEMGAIAKNFGIGEAAKMAIAAGSDMLAVCAAPDAIRASRDAVLSAAMKAEISFSGALSRIGDIKKSVSPPLHFDTERLDALSARNAALAARLSR